MDRQMAGQMDRWTNKRMDRQMSGNSSLCPTGHQAFGAAAHERILHYKILMPPVMAVKDENHCASGKNRSFWPEILAILAGNNASQ